MSTVELCVPPYFYDVPAGSKKSHKDVLLFNPGLGTLFIP